MACVDKRTRDVAAQAFKLAFPCGKAECKCAKLCEECQTSFEDAGSWVCEYDTILPHLGKKMTGGRAKACQVYSPPPELCDAIVRGLRDQARSYMARQTEVERPELNMLQGELGNLEVLAEGPEGHAHLFSVD